MTQTAREKEMADRHVGRDRRKDRRADRHESQTEKEYKTVTVSMTGLDLPQLSPLTSSVAVHSCDHGTITINLAAAVPIASGRCYTSVKPACARAVDGASTARVRLL